MMSSMSSIHIENGFLRATVLPGIGAKIFDLIHRPTGFNFLWHNPRIQPQPYAIEANFDNYWCGGWDDAFPTCEACTYRGEQYPNLGELRSISWTVESQSADSVTLSAFGPISPVRARKTVRLNGHALEMSYEVENLGPAAIDFLWGTHPAYAVSAQTKLHVPARRGIVGVSSHPSLGVVGQQYHWPMLGEEDISLARAADANLSCGHYATDLTGGWYAVEHTDRKQTLLFEFDRETCPNLWLWLSYGGWRGYHLAVVEPWTSRPVTLSEAVEAGTHRTLPPGGRFQTRVRATVGDMGVAADELIGNRERLA
jgi:galactose mutarotase-like enzyme